MSSKNRIAVYEINSGLRPFKTLRIFLILQIEVDTHSGGIFTDEIEYGKIRYPIF